MKPRFVSLFGIAFSCLFVAAFPAFGGVAYNLNVVGYQGRLNDNGAPVTGSFDLQFTLFATATGGSPVAGPVTAAPTAVSNGLFSVMLDFGGGVFNGANRWIEIAVRPFGSLGAYQTLSPRQPLTAAPYALRAQSVSAVADSALSTNVALLTSSPMFSTPVKAPILRLTDVTGAGALNFGNNPDNICAISVDPAGPAGLLLRDPKGIRILSPDPMKPPTLRFGPTDDCSIGIDPAFPGLVERDPIGFRLLGLNNQGCRLIFGPTMNCTVEVDPAGPAGLLLRDPSGIRILSPDPQRFPTLRFGPTDDCSIGIDPAFPGMIVLDPFGLRINPPGANAVPRLLFGPTDDCSIGIDPAFPGMIVLDPFGLRLKPPGANAQPRLIFGPTMDCTVEVRPPGTPGAVTGLLLRDPNGIRIFNPVATGVNRIRFGPTDDCTIFAPGPNNSGMNFTDPRGFVFGSQMTVNGPVFAQAFIQTSSRRFKNDVKPIEEPLEKIAKLQGVRFTWNKEKGGQRDIGFIAEEVAKVIPEVVAMEEDGENARGVKYDHLVAVAIEGIKAQQSQIQTLEREKAELKESLEAMQAKLDRLSQKLEALPPR